jgi:Holliday junction resolvase RusA-like endonuclease
MKQIQLTVLDAPTGKGRPRFNRASGRAYTPAKTLTAEARIRHAWDEAGQPTIPEGVPITAIIDLYVDRPMSHYKRDGTLTTKGEREPIPFRQKPDVDNAAKLCLDALEKYAYQRDVAIVNLGVHRHWTESRSDHPRVVITLLGMEAA